jgi:hypothetical protein
MSTKEPATLESLSGQVHALDAKLTDHIREEMSLIGAAFPDGDADGHRRAHEAMIQSAKAQQKFWEDLRLDLAKKGVWSVLIIALGLLVFGLSAKIGIPLKP